MENSKKMALLTMACFALLTSKSATAGGCLEFSRSYAPDARVLQVLSSRGWQVTNEKLGGCRASHGVTFAVGDWGFSDGARAWFGTISLVKFGEKKTAGLILATGPTRKYVIDRLVGELLDELP